MKYYIASRLENAATVRKLATRLNAEGWVQTYDWTQHGSVEGESVERISEVAQAEIQGVKDAELVIVLLPGGRGTHVELGAAIALGKPVFLYAERERHFYQDGRICAFYKHPGVFKVDDFIKDIMIAERREDERNA
jgi:nucleoside 2-deoxyribosyltransferase